MRAAPVVFQPPSLRLALGLGDQELEQRVRPALDATDDLVVVAQCLAADQLLQAVEAREVDAVVVAWTLHRLTDSVLDQVERSGLPVVLLVPEPTDARWLARRGPTLALHTDAATIRQAILDARRGERIRPTPKPTSEPLSLKAEDRVDTAGPARIVAVTGGVGSPGRTTIAINLAAALGAVAPTVLVEADLDAPSIAAYLDLDPSRNLCTLAHAVRDDSHAWSTAIADEVQQLSRHGRSAGVICGPPKREMRTSIAPAFVASLIRELTRHYSYVVLDVGAELAGTGTAATNHRAALASAEQVLLVSAADLVGLWHARTALDQLERYLGTERQRVGLVLNRHDARHHHSPAEVEWHLGAPLATVVPFEHAAMQRAIGAQEPLVWNANNRATRALIDLAERVHDGKVQLPAHSARGDRVVPWWRRLLPRRSGASPRRTLPGAQPARAASSRDRHGSVSW